MVRRYLARKRCYPSGSRLSNPARVVAPALQTIERQCHVRPAGHYRNYAKRCKVRTKVTDADVSRPYRQPVDTTHQAACTGKYH